MNLLLHFWYMAPNRRDDKTVVDMTFEWSDEDTAAIFTGWTPALDLVRRRFEEAGIGHEALRLLDPPETGQALDRFGALACRIGLDLQTACGHRVALARHRVLGSPPRLQVIFEHAETSVGEQAVFLAMALLGEAFPALDLRIKAEAVTQGFSALWPGFKKRSMPMAEPPDTTAIFEAARRRGIPVVRLERDPYEPVQGDFRLRMYSMLMLGHCGHRQIIDGTFALEKQGPGVHLLGAPHRFPEFAVQLGLPHVPASTPVEPDHLLLIAGHRWVATLDLESGQAIDCDTHPDLVSMAERVSRQLVTGLLAVYLRCGDPTAARTGPALLVTRLDPAPRLDELLGPRQDLVDRAAEAFVDWLIPDEKAGRVPLVAVTGTNGKTTTCRMVDAIMRRWGKTSGLQCTDGRYIAGTLVEEKDASMVMGHYRIFEDPTVEVAVLECHHRGLAEYGLGFFECDVGICTNVSWDHIGTFDTHSVEDMAAIKVAVPSRATRRAVLNADDPHCMAMIPALQAPLCGVSLERPAADLLAELGQDACACVVETVDGAEWVVHHGPRGRDRIIAVRDIPASFGGAARHNLHNAMSAVGAAMALDVPVHVIREALGRFQMDSENTPWRANFYPGLPFQVLVDFAHNPDGMRRIAEFTGNLEVAGRRIVAFSGFRDNDHIIRIADALSGHFDHYVIKEYDAPDGYSKRRSAGEISALVDQRLASHGIPAERRSVIIDEREAIRGALEMAKPGDLVVLLLGYKGMTFIGDLMRDYIREYRDSGS